LHGYDLVRRNCATELRAVMDEVLDPVSAARPRSAGEALARGVATEFAFFPYASQQEVERTYLVASRRQIASYRTRRLDELSRDEAPLGVAIRESNTLTSTVYRRSRDDWHFLFFNDVPLLFRPLVGAVNLLVCLGAGLVGLVALPVDRGETLACGTRGCALERPRAIRCRRAQGLVRLDRPARTRERHCADGRSQGCRPCAAV